MVSYILGHSKIGEEWKNVYLQLPFLSPVLPIQSQNILEIS